MKSKRSRYSSFRDAKDCGSQGYQMDECINVKIIVIIMLK